ncbi:MAG: hypothetical protein JKX84_11670, partial [Flavobacteriales bacterium]|nr:hypothetical protein [Flavobacteriales bacterium]
MTMLNETLNEVLNEDKSRPDSGKSRLLSGRKAFAIITVIILGMSAVLQAQNPHLDGSKREKLQALKVGYLTDKLNLTPEEAQTFWPLYNEMETKMRSIRKEKHQNRRNTKENYTQMSDKELIGSIEIEL